MSTTSQTILRSYIIINVHHTQSNSLTGSWRERGIRCVHCFVEVGVNGESAVFIVLSKLEGTGNPLCSLFFRSWRERGIRCVHCFVEVGVNGESAVLIVLSKLELVVINVSELHRTF